jgi:hypothetical protein
MRLIPALLVTTLLAAGCSAAPKHVHPVTEAGPTIQLFNGKDLDGWYTFTSTTGYDNPGVFTVVDGCIKAAGGAGDVGYFGGVITKKEYSNYRLTFDYKFGEPTYGTRHNKSRDAGLLLHCIGPNIPGKPWMTSYEYQIIEGGTGDILVVNYGKDNMDQPVTLKITAEVVKDGKQRYWKEGAPWESWENSGRLNWYGRDPEWKDVVGYRGRQDVQSVYNEWTHCEVIALNDTLTYYVNGKLVNRCKGLNVTKGKLLFQTEGAECYYKNIELTPIK